MAEIGVHVSSGRVAGLASVEDDYRPTGSSQRQSSRETGCAAAHDDNLATLRLDSLLEADADDADVVIRPLPTAGPGVTTWPLSQPTGTRPR
ncbi:MAG: hypothetical protein ACR2MA_00440 [Egibacteraceae bacterium]